MRFSHFSSWIKQLARPRRSRAGQKRPRRRAFLQLEGLEDRVVPTGTWTQVTAPAPDALGTMFLLPNGTVMAQGPGTAAFYQLTPDSTGSYQNGTWTTLPSMPATVGDADGTRLYYGSVVLPTDQLIVYGGEYVDGSTTPNDGNSGVIYNMATNTWTPIPIIPASLETGDYISTDEFGDSYMQLLPDGNVLALTNGDQTPAIYNPTTQTWSAAGTKLDGPGSTSPFIEGSDEEAFVKLPGTAGNILDYEIEASDGVNPGYAEYYNPATNSWLAAGTVPVALSSDPEGELGPALLLPPSASHPQGAVFQVGANGATYGTPTNTAIYDVATNTWAAGPQIPGNFTADDAPGAILPDGNVIFAADASASGVQYDTPTHIFEYNPTTNAISQLALPAALSGVLNSEPSFPTRMLVLPTGQVAFSDGSDNTLWLYSETGAVSASWQPTISTVSLVSGNNYTLSGTQLNGISEGASYGDDAQMATNYPIVQITDSTGKVFYATTSNWTDPGTVATGATPETTDFTLPAGVAPGNFSVEVIANGIASASFAFGATQPTVTSISPNSGPTTGGTSVVITGTNFTGVTGVKFGGTAATSYTVNSATQITATAPGEGPATVDVTVATAAGTSVTSSSDQFTFSNVIAPVVTSVSTTTPSGTYGAGTLIPITVSFSAPVVVTGTPTLALNTTPGAVASYAGGGAGISTLASFSGAANGAVLVGNLFEDSSGNFFGTTTNGGAANDGTVFEIAAGTHALTTLVTFTGANGDGPEAGLVEDSSGDLFGTTYNGGASNDGTVFEIAAGTHALTTVVTFSGANGSNPYCTLLEDSSGNFFGTTYFGGASDNGTVFEIDAGTHALTTVASFAGGAGGSEPTAGLIEDSSGNFFGTTLHGGPLDDGTVFEVSAGTITTLATFTGANGANPDGGLVEDSAGNLYGTTVNGGASGDGTVFEVSGGTLSTLVTFTGAANGANPSDTLLEDSSGNLFGTTKAGGASNDGIVFELAAGTHALTTVATFTAATGRIPVAGLIEDSSGNLFGTTYGGGSSNDGTVFEIGAGNGSTLTFTYAVAAGQSDPRLDYTNTSALALSGGTIESTGGANAALTLPAIGSDGLYSQNIIIGSSVPTVTGVSPNSGGTGGGTTVVITGTNFTGATQVKFGGTAATSFTVNSATQITAVTSAEAAATVDVEVTTPGGTSAASASDKFTFQANSLQINSLPNPQFFTVNTSTNFALGTIADSNPLATTWNVTVNWGDGSANTVFVAASTTIPAKPHTFTTAGPYTVTVSVSDSFGASTQSTFQADVTGTGPNLIFVKQPSSVVAGANAGAVTVKALDFFGYPVKGVTVLLSIPGTTLYGTLSAVTNVSGIATFSSLSVHQVGVYTLFAKAKSTAVSQVSNSFTISVAAPGLVTYLVSPPAKVTAGTALNTTVQIADKYGNPEPANIHVSLALNTGKLSSGTPTAATNALGQASFTNLIENKTGTYRFVVSVTSAVKGTSTAFIVSATIAATSQASTPTTVSKPAVLVQTANSGGSTGSDQSGFSSLIDAIGNTPGTVIADGQQASAGSDWFSNWKGWDFLP